jgi:hypothetical protein
MPMGAVTYVRDKKHALRGMLLVASARWWWIDMAGAWLKLATWPRRTVAPISSTKRQLNRLQRA